MIRIWCEWDFGQENLVFASREAAMKWVTDNVLIDEYVKENFCNAEDLVRNGLIGFETLEFIE
jgi:hypothetical protein